MLRVQSNGKSSQQNHRAVLFGFVGLVIGFRLVGARSALLIALVADGPSSGTPWLRNEHHQVGRFYIAFFVTVPFPHVRTFGIRCAGTRRGFDKGSRGFVVLLGLVICFLIL